VDKGLHERIDGTVDDAGILVKWEMLERWTNRRFDEAAAPQVGLEIVPLEESRPVEILRCRVILGGRTREWED
jgi:hypothetical protein